MITKQIGKFKAQFKKSFDKESGDFVNLEITFGNELKKLLKSICVEEDVDFELPIGQDETGNTKRETYKRYKAKRVIYSSFYSDYRDVLFIKELVDDGKIVLKFYETQKLDKVMESMKENIKRLVEVVLKYDEVTQEVNYNL